MNDNVVLILYVIIEKILPPLTVILSLIIAWYVIKAIVSFLTGIVSTPSEREQQQRHRRENFVARMAILCFVVGVVLSIFGYGEGSIEIKLPYDVVISGAGVGIVLISAMCFILYLLLRLVYSQSEKSQLSGVDGNSLTASILPSSHVNSAPFISSRYIKIGLITLVLLPILGPFALIVGGLLIWKMSKS